MRLALGPLLLAALATATGCFHPNYDHLACSPAGDCPDDMACVDGFCQSSTVRDAADDVVDDASDAPIDVPIDDAPIDANPTDRDNDTIANVDDNCPDTANTLQANEDGDALGDACDPCPIDVDNTDGDSDGVGDKCDPNPATGGDALILFEGFAGTSVPATLTSIGTWTVSNGAASSSSASTSAPSSLSFLAAGVRETVSTRAAVTAFAGSGTSVIGVGQNLTANQSTGSFCELVRLTGTGMQTLLALVENPMGALQQTTSTTIGLNTVYSLVLFRDDDLYRCTKDLATVSDTASGAHEPVPYDTVFVQNSSARFEYMMVVSSP